MVINHQMLSLQRFESIGSVWDQLPAVTQHIQQKNGLGTISRKTYSKPTVNLFLHIFPSKIQSKTR